MKKLQKSKKNLLSLPSLVLLSALSSTLPPSVLSSQKCIKDLNCVCDDALEVIDCKNLGLKKVPTGIPESAQTLYLDDNELTILSDLGDLSNLRMLSVTNNKLKNIQFDVFDNMDNLQVLKLGRNQLNSLDDDVFEWNPLKLEVIDLSHNKFKFIQHFLFYDLERLQQIDLSNNDLSFIHPHAFQQLKELRQLELSNNHLRSFDPTWIKHMGQNGVQDINLKANPWSCDCGMEEAFDFMKEPANRWFNDLTNAKIYCNSEKYREITNPIPPLIKDANFGQNQLFDPTNNSPDIKKFPCSAPKITGISKSSKIHAGKTVLLRCVATGLPKPTIAWIAPNNDVYRLNSDNFKGVTVDDNGDLKIENLKKTDGGKYICQATSNAGKNKNNVVQVTTELEIVDDSQQMQDNSKNLNENIENQQGFNMNEHCPSQCHCSGELVDCSFDAVSNGQDRLTSLPAFSNEAKNILRQTAHKYYLQNNDISKISSSSQICGIFQRLIELKMDENRINFIDQSAFDDCDRLELLSLRKNQISRIEPNMFINMPQLETLILDENMVTEIRARSFSNLPKLRWLYMRYGSLHAVSPEAFYWVGELFFEKILLLLIQVQNRTILSK